MKKRELVMIICVLAIISIFPSVLALNETSGISDTSIVTKAYQCLDNQIKEKVQTKLSLEEAIFSSLALGPQENLKATIESERRPGDSCWPKDGCKLKETAEVAIAYKRIGKDTTDIEKWLLSKAIITKDLDWYLEIDATNHIPATCTITYDGADKEVRILDNMKLEGNAGSCLTVSSSRYWLQIKPACLDKEFEISCNQDFITTLIYQKNDATYISSETHSSASGGSTKEITNAKCFKNIDACDYEGTIWATLALHKLGRDTSAFTSYLLALSEDNQKYLPSAFLYIIAGGDDQFSQIIQKQKDGKYWETSANKRYYDTSLAMLALSGTSSAELENTKKYLLSIAKDSGCWNNNNIRDTAFILYSGWPKDFSIPTETKSCMAAGYFCITKDDCTEAGGEILSNECNNFNMFCCSKSLPEKTCAEKNGIICNANQECRNGNTAPASDGTCCLSKICDPISTQNTCELSGDICRFSSCASGEEQVIKNCDTSDKICCEKTSVPTSSLNTWIWILVVLIIIVVLGIIFRNKIRVWWFKFQGKARSSPITRPGIPPAGGYYGMPRQQRMIPKQYNSSRPQSNARDKEMEETLKKLRDMSK